MLFNVQMRKCVNVRIGAFRGLSPLEGINLQMERCVNVRIGAFRGLSPLEGINLHIYQSAHSHINHVLALLRYSTWRGAQHGGVLWESTCP